MAAEKNHAVEITADAGSPGESTARADGSSPARLPFSAPRLISYGRLVDVTLAGTPGAGDSGSGGGMENFPGP